MNVVFSLIVFDVASDEVLLTLVTGFPAALPARGDTVTFKAPDGNVLTGGVVRQVAHSYQLTMGEAPPEETLHVETRLGVDVPEAL